MIGRRSARRPDGVVAVGGERIEHVVEEIAHRERESEVVALPCDAQAPHGVAGERRLDVRIVAAHAYPMPVFYDTHGAASDAYDAPATSYIVAIDKAGKVRYTGVGGDQDLNAVIKAVVP